MMSQGSRSACAVALCVAFTIAVAGCAGSTSTTLEPRLEDAAPPSSAVASIVDTPTSALVTTEAPTTVESTVAPAADSSINDGESCIEGDWTISEEQLDGYYAELGAVSGVPMSTTGTTRIRFIDSQFVYDAVFDLEMDLDGQRATAKSDGVATGSYVVEDGVISTELAANSISIVVNVAGFEIDAGGLGNDLLTSFPINDAAFNCDGPTIFFDTGGAEPHPIELARYEG